MTRVMNHPWQHHLSYLNIISFIQKNECVQKSFCCAEAMKEAETAARTHVMVMITSLQQYNNKNIIIQAKIPQ